MPEILYSKFSKDRQKKFQIATMIVEENGEKSVIKKAMHKEGEAHVRKMVKSRELLSELFVNSGVEMCPCKEENGQVRFLFVEGESLEERIHRHSEANDYEALKKECIHSRAVRHLKKFLAFQSLKKRNIRQIFPMLI